MLGMDAEKPFTLDWTCRGLACGDVTGIYRLPCTREGEGRETAGERAGEEYAVEDFSELRSKSPRLTTKCAAGNGCADFTCSCIRMVFALLKI